MTGNMPQSAGLRERQNISDHGETVMGIVVISIFRCPGDDD